MTRSQDWFATVAVRSFLWMVEPRRTQASRRQAAHDQIVQAALTVFALKGYSASSMDDICLAAGCSKGGLYHHFRTKSAVLSAVVNRLTAAGAALPPFEGEPALPRPALARILLDIWAEASRDAGLRNQLLDGHVTAGDVPALELGGLAALLRIGSIVQLVSRGDRSDPRQIAARLGIDRRAA